ncbi:MAG: hypothetical protein OQK94_06905 [Gammaproteobacteria bacterium]|nr:hypothetical protein [Gammaproteobacteria bacterium]MCW8841547.1 hypothetical protein [Gammaproteobacteria bacterium]MCW8927860.1 hypothetical protein [Gammaproteobacteria bacterium]MCW8958731.1 hypothetical protein [Gammaproteobacteria bacterium]MCW8973265.1 hypothetical protein [Gammaproteobacteria bacterium]
MAENLLYLCPKEFNTVPPDIPALASALQQIGFLGDTLDFHGEEHYRPGEEFLTLVTFLGCSPVIAMGEPGKTGEEFCHIALDGPIDKPRFIGGDNIKIPRCPSCGHRFETWQELIEQWQQQPAQLLDCPECGRSLNVTELRWRKSAGFGRFFIKVWGIFESEAVPNPNLLSILEKQTGTPWLHFYIRRQ